MSIHIVKTGKTWCVTVNGNVVEGGFFTRAAAVHCAELWSHELAFTGLVSES